MLMANSSITSTEANLPTFPKTADIKTGSNQFKQLPSFSQTFKVKFVLCKSGYLEWQTTRDFSSKYSDNCAKQHVTYAHNYNLRQEGDKTGLSIFPMSVGLVKS